MEKIVKKLNAVAVVALCIALILGGIALYKITAYENSEYSWGNRTNAYVGGDAYNYIINGTYFSGLSSLSGAFFVCSCISYSIGLYIKGSLAEKAFESNKEHIDDTDEIPDL